MKGITNLLLACVLVMSMMLAMPIEAQGGDMLIVVYTKADEMVLNWLHHARNSSSRYPCSGV